MSRLTRPAGRRNFFDRYSNGQPSVAIGSDFFPNYKFKILFSWARAVKRIYQIFFLTPNLPSFFFLYFSCTFFWTKNDHLKFRGGGQKHHFWTDLVELRRFFTFLFYFSQKNITKRVPPSEFFKKNDQKWKFLIKNWPKSVILP